MKPITCYEGAHGNLKKSQEAAVCDIIAAAGCGTVASAIGSNNDIEVVRVREAILWAADKIRKRKPKPR